MTPAEVATHLCVREFMELCAKVDELSPPAKNRHFDVLMITKHPNQIHVEIVADNDRGALLVIRRVDRIAEAA